MNSCLLKLALMLNMLFAGQSLLAQECNGAAILTHENVLYGRFEVTMQSAAGSGIISSFFLYNVDVGCNWPDENNEIDIEMTGNTDSLHFTTHHPGGWFTGEAFDFEFNPHETMQSYAMEWEPDIVRWFVDDQLIYVQDAAYVQNLEYPMRIIMNLYASAHDWAGVWDPTAMPASSSYEFVRYFSYTPGSGTSGTGNNFSLEWEDNFDQLDLNRWEVDEFGGFGGNRCTFRKQNVEVDNGLLTLTIDEPDPNPQPVPVTFSVNTKEIDLESGDQIFLNGTFNSWCGNCEPMTADGDIWSVTLNMIPGKYEYLFTRNLWEENGDAPLASECDFNPCDEYTNYGFVLEEGVTEMTLDRYCWKQCTDCTAVGVSTLGSPSKTLVKVVDLLGREVEEAPNQVLIFLYDDGSAEKKFVPQPIQ